MKCLVPRCEVDLSEAVSFCEAHLASYLDYLQLDADAQTLQAALVQSPTGREQLAQGVAASEPVAEPVPEPTPLAEPPEPSELAPEPTLPPSETPCAWGDHATADGRYICLACSLKLLPKVKETYRIPLENTHSDALLLDKLAHEATAKSVLRDIEAPGRKAPAMASDNSPGAGGNGRWIVLGALAVLGLAVPLVFMLNQAPPRLPSARPVPDVSPTPMARPFNTEHSLAKFRILTTGNGPLGFSESADFYSVGMPAAEFRLHFGPPNTEEGSRWQYPGDGLVATVAHGKVVAFEFYELPLDGFNVAPIGIDRGFDRQQSVRELYKAYGQAFKAVDDRYVFRCRSGQITYTYKFGAIQSIRLSQAN